MDVYTAELFPAHADGQVPPALPHVSSFFLSWAIMPAVRIVKSFSVFYHIWMRWTTDLWNEIKEKALVFTLNTFLGRWSFYLKPHVFIEIIACTEFFTPRNSFDRIVDDLSVPSVVFTAYSCFSFKKRCFCSRAFVFRQTSSRGNHIFLGFLKKGRWKNWWS